MDFFKEKTYNNSIICGRKTFEGFTIKPLPKRKNIVLSKSNFSYDNVTTFSEISDLLGYIKSKKEETFLVCGGESIYRQLLPYCSKMYITKFEEREEIRSDSYFPKIDENIWKVVDKIQGKSENPKLTFYTYVRI